MNNLPSEVSRVHTTFGQMTIGRRPACNALAAGSERRPVQTIRREGVERAESPRQNRPTASFSAPGTARNPPTCDRLDVMALCGHGGPLIPG